MKAQSNRRQIDLNLPIVLSATLTRRRFLAGTGVILTSPFLITARGAAGIKVTRSQPADTTRVRFRLVDAQTGQTTPAMACLSNANSGNRLDYIDYLNLGFRLTARAAIRPGARRLARCEPMCIPARPST